MSAVDKKEGELSDLKLIEASGTSKASQTAETVIIDKIKTWTIDIHIKQTDHRLTPAS
jgi:hypothetical protein